MDDKTSTTNGSPYPLAEISPDPVLCCDRHWGVTFANLQVRQLAGHAGEELGEHTYWDLFPEVRGLPLERFLRNVMDTRSHGNMEFHHAQSRTWRDVQAFPFKDGLAIYYRDITDRKLAEQLRQTTAREIQEFFDATPDFVLGIAPDWTITFCNKAARARSTPEEIVGADLFTRFPASAEEPFASHYRRSMQQRVQTDFESFVPAPYNICLKIVARPFADGILVLYSDITALKNAEAARDASSRELQQVLEVTTDAVVSLNRQWIITFVNRSARHMLGRDDLVGKHLWEQFPAAVESQIFLRYHETMEQRTPCDFEEFYPDPLNMCISIQCRPSDDGIVVFSHDITEERRSRQALLDQQATLAFLQGTAHIATWVVDLDTGTMRISEGSSPIYGRPNYEIKNVTDIYRLMHPDDLKTMLGRHERPTLEASRGNSQDYRIIAEDGTTRWLEGRAVAVCSADGRATHLRGMTMDITARKLEEEKVANSEARYRVLVDLNPQTLWIGEADGRISYANHGYVEYRGVETEELLGSRWNEGFHPDDQEPAMKAWMHSVETGEDYAIEARIPNSEGEYRWWAIRALPVRDETNKILSWLGIAHDIHDANTATEALRQKQEETERQRAEIESVYRIAPIGLALFDPVHFRYLRLNDRQAEIVGMSREELIGRSPMDIAHVEGVREMFESVAAGRPIRDMELEGELPSRPGERRFWIVNFNPVYAADGTVEAIAGSSQEITQQKKAEAALVQSEKLAAVGRLASSISHEINNPLEAITNILYIVATDPQLPASALKYVNMAQSELARVSQIATQTLRFHRQAVHRTQVTAADLVNAVLNLYQGRLNNSGITIDTSYASSTPILCFENDIRQVLNNLISNAIDAMRGGGRLIARAHNATRTVPGGDSIHGVRITIADTGHGMSPATRARVFEPFYTTKDLNGTGLGLWISAGIVDRHHGSLTLRSSQHLTHHGTVFSLFLPV